MIKSAQQRQELFEKNINDSSFLSKKIKCDYLTSKGVDVSNFYSLNDCALMLVGENLSVTGKVTEDDMETILSFCQFLGVYGLEIQDGSLPMKRKTMFLMKYAGEKCGSCTDIIVNENVYSFSEFCIRNFAGVSFNTIYAYLAKKVSRGIADIYYLTENRKIVSGAVAIRYGMSDIYVTFVSTDSSHRHKGMAAKVIRHIISQNPGRNVILMCEEKLKDFYTRLGFVHNDNIYLYTLREESF